MAQQKLQMFGGDWTQQKLEMLRAYLSRYTTALEKSPFQLAYIDAFAGTGYRELKEKIGGKPLLFDELAEEEPQSLLDGSARMALQVQPPFHRYVFIERDPKRFERLQRLKEDFPSKAEAIRLYQGDANTLLQEWCARGNWKEWRAVLFLDPFGMQIDWRTMEAVARTRAMDVWILFPLGIGVNRLLTKDPARLPAAWRSRLNRMFGAEDWFEMFYRKEAVSDLLGKREELRKACTFETISGYYQEKLRTVFAKVADNPRLLPNSRGNPIFQLCFAVGNSGRGGEIAIRIAQHILKAKEE